MHFESDDNATRSNSTSAAMRDLESRIEEKKREVEEKQRELDALLRQRSVLHDVEISEAVDHLPSKRQKIDRTENKMDLTLQAQESSRRMVIVAEFGQQMGKVSVQPKATEFSWDRSNFRSAMMFRLFRSPPRPATRISLQNFSMPLDGTALVAAHLLFDMHSSMRKR